MERRTAALVLGAVVLVLGLAAGGFLTYPFSYDTPHRVDSEVEQFTVDVSDEFHLNGRVVGTGGELIVEYEAMRAADGKRYEHFENSVTERTVYQTGPDGTRYGLYRYPDNESAQSAWTTAERIESRTVVAEKRVDGEIRLLVVDENPDPTSATIEGGQTMLYNGLQSFTAFDRVESDGDTSVYEPQTGWYRHAEHSGPFRVTNASGQITVDAETNAVQSADVFVRYTTASNYLEYLRGTGKTHTVETTVDVHEAPATIEEPDWVEEIRARR